MEIFSKVKKAGISHAWYSRSGVTEVFHRPVKYPWRYEAEGFSAEVLCPALFPLQGSGCFPEPDGSWKEPVRKDRVRSLRYVSFAGAGSIPYIWRSNPGAPFLSRQALRRMAFFHHVPLPVV